MTKEFSPSKKILTQLRECGRVIDLNGRPLMAADLEEEVYKLRRYREAEYGYNPAVDCWASRPVRNLLASSMRDFYHFKYGMSPNESVLCDAPYDLYGFPASGSTLMIVTVPGIYSYFDPVLWFVDVANTTDEWDLLEPNRHLVITGFSGFGFKE